MARRTTEDLTLFTNFLLMRADTTPINVAPIRARLRRGVERATRQREPVVWTALPAAESERLQAWILMQGLALHHANHRHMSAMLQRLTFEPERAATPTGR